MAGTTRFWTDPYSVGKPPDGKSWQWVNKDDLEAFLATGWLPVERLRIPGDCDHFLFGGAEVIAFDGSVLVERDEELTKLSHAECIAKAHQNVIDWLNRNGGAAVRIGYTFGGKTEFKEYNPEGLLRPAEAKALQAKKEKELIHGQAEAVVVTGEGAGGASGEPAQGEAGADDEHRSGGVDGAGSAGAPSGSASADPDTDQDA